MSNASYWVWRKSSFSQPNGNECVEVGWRKSSFSEGGENTACVEVAHLIEVVGVRDTKDRSAGQLTFVPPVWSNFLRSLDQRFSAGE